MNAVIELALISHTNAGKTTLARTLLGRDIGEVRDAPHVTDIAESHVLLRTDAGDQLRLWDTPGFGDSARLVQRLRMADNPIGWFLREVWDRYRDRPFWCSQQAMRVARDNSDVMLYLVNAAEHLADAGYVASEAQVLRWLGKPVVVLLNQTGPPRPAHDERAEAESWRHHMKALGVDCDVLALDAFARCWVQERVLLDVVGRLLPEAKQTAHARLVATWTAHNVARFDASMKVLTEQLTRAAVDEQMMAPSEVPATSAMQKLIHSVVVKRNENDAARERAMQQLAERLDAQVRSSTDHLIALHDLDGEAARTVLHRMHDNFALPERIDETRTALWSSVITGALTGLKADLAAGGLTFGAGLLVGGVVGGLAGVGVARGFNRLAGSEQPTVRWSAEFLDGLARSSVLRYLAVAHFGRGRGRYVEGEAPAFWRVEVEQQFALHRSDFAALWKAAAEPASPSSRLVPDLQRELTRLTIGVLERFYPGTVPRELRS